MFAFLFQQKEAKGSLFLLIFCHRKIFAASHQAAVVIGVRRLRCALLWNLNSIETAKARHHQFLTNRIGLWVRLLETNSEGYFRARVTCLVSLLGFLAVEMSVQDMTWPLRLLTVLEDTPSFCMFIFLLGLKYSYVSAVLNCEAWAEAGRLETAAFLPGAHNCVACWFEPYWARSS